MTIRLDHVAWKYKSQNECGGTFPPPSIPFFVAVKCLLTKMYCPKICCLYHCQDFTVKNHPDLWKISPRYCVKPQSVQVMDPGILLPLLLPLLPPSLLPPSSFPSPLPLLSPPSPPFPPPFFPFPLLSLPSSLLLPLSSQDAVIRDGSVVCSGNDGGTSCLE